jgi:hypothetical protein
MHLGNFSRYFAALVLACQLAQVAAQAATKLQLVPLPDAQGTIVGTAFSPDSSQIAILRHFNGPSTSGARHTIQVVDLKSGHEVSQGELPNGSSSDTIMSTHFLVYSFDGRRLLLGASGTDDLLILDTVNLQVSNRVALHPEKQLRRSLSEGNRYFQGIVSVAVALNADVFGALTHDEQGINEIFVGSLSSGQISNSWGLGHGPTFGALGRTSLSFSDDGARLAVSLLPNEYKLSKDFLNVRVYSSEGRELMGIRTDGLTGYVELLPNGSLLTSRIDTPGLFSKKLCIEKWNLSTKAIVGRFCDPGRHIISLGVSNSHRLAAGSACQIRKDLEGNVLAFPGRVDVWNTESGTLAASSDDFPSLGPGDIQISSNGIWLFAGQMLFQIESPVEPPQ